MTPHISPFDCKQFFADERRVLLAAFHRNGGRTPPRSECEDLAARFTEARQGGTFATTAPEKAVAQPACWPASAVGLGRLPSFAFEEAEAWLMNDDAAVASLFAGDSWLLPSTTPAPADVQPADELEQRSRRCKIQSAAAAAPVVCGRQVKTWFENRRCSEKRARLGVKPRRQRLKQ